MNIERHRIEKELKALESRAKEKKVRLNDPTFRSKAPSDVIVEEEELLKDLEGQLSKWAESLKQMGSDPLGSDPGGSDPIWV